LSFSTYALGAKQSIHQIRIHDNKHRLMLNIKELLKKREGVTGLHPVPEGSS
jgi:hypothetical protein